MLPVNIEIRGSGGAAEDPIELKDVDFSAVMSGFTGNINATDRPASKATPDAPVPTEHMSASTEPRTILAVSCGPKPLLPPSALQTTPRSWSRSIALWCLRLSGLRLRSGKTGAIIIIHKRLAESFLMGGGFHSRSRAPSPSGAAFGFAALLG